MGAEKVKDASGENEFDGTAKAIVFIVAGAVGLFILPVAAVSAAVYFGIARRLSRPEAVIVAAGVAGGAALLAHGNPAKGYVGLWSNLVHQRWSDALGQTPWIPILAAATIVAMLARIALNTGVVAGGHEQERGTAGAKKGWWPFGKKQTALEQATDYESVIPDARTRDEIQIAPPPGNLFDVAPQNIDRHEGEQGQEPGKRDFPLAVGRHGTPVYLNEDELRMHALVFGSTGSGKTTMLKVLAGALLDLGWDGVILDHKEDVSRGGLRDWCELYTTTHSMPYQQIYLSEEDGRVWLNPIGAMSSDEARDTILAAQTFPDAFWEAINRNMLGQCIGMIYDAYNLDPEAIPSPSPMDIANVLRAGEGMRKASTKYLAVIAAHKYPDLLEQEREAKRHNREEEAKKKQTPGYQPRLKPAELIADKLSKEYPIIYNPSKDEVSAGRGFAARMESVYYTQVGRNVLNPSDGQRMLNIDAPGLSYIGLDSQGKPDLTKIISASVMRRICVLASHRIRSGGRNRPKFVIIDEANVVNRSSLQELLSRARSAGVCVIASTQSPGDYAVNLDGTRFDGPGFHEISQNTNVLIAMSQGAPEQAETLADYIGKEERYTAPIRATEEGDLEAVGSMRTEEHHLVTGEQLRDLRIGEAVMRVGKPRTRVAWCQFKMRND